MGDPVLVVGWVVQPAHVQDGRGKLISAFGRPLLKIQIQTWTDACANRPSPVYPHKRDPNSCSRLWGRGVIGFPHDTPTSPPLLLDMLNTFNTSVFTAQGHRPPRLFSLPFAIRVEDSRRVIRRWCARRKERETPLFT